MSRYWIFGLHDLGLRSGDVVFAFRDWAVEPIEFYDRLSDGESDAVAAFDKYRELMDLEFSTESVLDYADLLGDGWLLCPSCREAWQTSAVGELVRCPQCSVVLRNPRLPIGRH